MVDPLIKDLWIPTGLLLGFQMTFFKWRIEREVGLIDKSPPDTTPTFTYLVPSDYMSIVGMICFVVGVMLMPISGVLPEIAPVAFGVGVILFVGQLLGLAGHYDLFNQLPRHTVFFSRQEQIVVGLTILAIILYIAAYLIPKHA